MTRFLAAVGALLLASAAAAITPDTLTPFRSVPPEIAGRFRDARGLYQAAAGHYLLFDRRAHRVHGLDEAFASAWDIVDIGAEPGRILDPTAFAVAPDGSFVVADAPAGRARIQVFSPAGFRTAGFYIAQGARPRLVLDNVVMSGIASLQYTGSSLLVSQPETGALVSEYSVSGTAIRSVGTLRATGHESDADVHLALNSGIPVVLPSGDICFVFQAGPPVFRRYDREGRLVYERLIQGIDVDPVMRALPSTWPRNPLDGELPLVRPTIRAAAADADGRLWIAFDAGFVYVFDAEGDKIRAVRLRGAGPIVPTTMTFGRDGQLIVTPGLHEFRVR